MRAWRLAALLVVMSGLQPMAAMAQAAESSVGSDEAESEAQPGEWVRENESPADVEVRPWALQLAAEVGFGMRAVDLPLDGVIYRIRTGVHPALGLSFRLDHHAAQHVSIGLSARYQSSIGLVLEEQLTGGTLHPRKTRSHQVEVGLAPRLHWDESGWAISGLFGYSVVELDPENHLVTPSYHLGGPHARIAVRIPLGSERVCLTVGPEGQLTLQTGAELMARGVSARGFGVGASAALDVHLSERWWIAATYRELRFGSSTHQGASFVDSMRVATAQLGGRL